jgi:hypothetical protein
MKFNLKDKHKLTDEYGYRTREGKKAIVQQVLDIYLGEDFRESKKREVLGDLFEKVIERDANLYFKMMKFAGESNEYNYREFHKFFSGVPYFDHAVIAVRKDISIVGGFSQEILSKLLREFLNK